MSRLRSGTCVLFLLGLLLPGRALGQDVAGNWNLHYVIGGATESTLAIVKLEETGGKVTGSLVAGSPRILGLEVVGAERKSNLLRVSLKAGSTSVVFEGPLPKGKAGRLPGSLAINDNLYPAVLTATDRTELDAKSLTRVVDCPPMMQARVLSQRGLILRFQAQRETDADKKAALLKQAEEASKAALVEVPRRYRQVLEKHGDSPAVFEAGLTLLRSAKEAKEEEVKSWAETVAQAAQAYGPRWQGEVAAQVAAALAKQKGLSEAAARFAREAAGTLTEETPAAVQAKVLGVVASALEAAGRQKEAAEARSRLAKIEQILDRDYLEKMPPFKGTPFAGRKEKSERAVFMELFTGVMCPPCVAADLAFDVLCKTYQPAELVLVQYHLHIPGPDPLTNPDTEARWNYYRKAFPKEIRGVPSSVFDGTPQAGGGGSVAGAEKKYATYRSVIDPLLEKPANAKITLHARRKGERIDIRAEVAGLKNPGADKKLRFLLAEESIRYVGSNRIRFHHNVVRAFPGGVEGQALMDATSKHEASIDLGDLRGRLVKYLDEYEATRRPFANPSRPLDFADLRVIAIVQDDATQEILQAVQVEVEKK